jgi:hypothetical protein
VGCCLVGPLVDIPASGLIRSMPIIVCPRGITQTRSVRALSGVYIVLAGDLGFFTTLAFWLRSSVVSVLNSLITIMKAPPSLLII